MASSKRSRAITRGSPSRRSSLDLDPATSERLSRIRQRGTAPELVVGAVLRELGLRYRTRNRDLPGSPDFANRTGRWAVFVHGCFWHHHAGCVRATVPKRNRSFWLEKFAANRRRDARAVRMLRARGFRVVVVWECRTGALPVIRRAIVRALTASVRSSRDLPRRGLLRPPS